MRFQSSHETGRRPGMVLLIVMALLALFATVALSFVFYADSAAVASQMNRASMQQQQSDLDTELLAAYFLNQLLYDTDNIYSAMRGHSLARSIYGYNPKRLNFTPYNGVGRESFAPSTTNDPDFTTVPMFNMINNQTFYNPAALATDKTVNFVRTPEYYGKVSFLPTATPPSPTSSAVGPASYRYVGGANAPWTGYDTNSLFLAEVTADGTVLMPSFSRPWTASGIPATSLAAKYVSLRPDLGWNRDPNNPANNQTLNGVSTSFITPDTDTGGDVKNLEYGKGSLVGATYYNNDSKWMDLGFPILTAPNGKRYKALFAPLVVDQSNKLHLWAHGNQSGTAGSLHASNIGYGPPSVNLTKLPGGVGIAPPGPPATRGATEAGATVTIRTTTAHGFTVGQVVAINGVTDNTGAPAPGYNGAFTITVVPNATTFRFTDPTPLLPVNAGNGTVMPLAELLALYNLRYGGANAVGAVPNLKAGPSYAQVDADALNPATGLSSRPFFMAIQTRSTNAITGVPAAGAIKTVNVSTNSGNVAPSIATPFPWNFADASTAIVPGVTQATVGTETVTITGSTATSITAFFRQNHPVGTQISLGMTFGFPNFPAGWSNANAAETTNNPLAFNLLNPTFPNILPLAMSNQEALLRFGGTGSPALTSKIFQLMPSTFSNPRARNMVTLSNWHLDRITGAPFLNFSRTTTGHYTYNAAIKYPTLVVASNPKPVYNTPGSAVTSTSATNPPWKTEFSTEWRSNLGNFLRVDLNRVLTDYPGAQALPDRVQFATDIYNALIRVTGAHDPNKPFVALSTTVDYKAARWLAQLAVNMVDYIDNDSIITVFPWHKTAGGVTVDTVFGTELPRLVMNEVYAQQETVPNSRINVWAELLNPLPNVAANNVTLQSGATPLYEIEIYGTTTIATAVTAKPADLTAWLRDPANNQGKGFPSVPAATVAPLATQSNWVPSTTTPSTTTLTTQVLPASAVPQFTPPKVIAGVAVPGATKAGTTVTITTTANHGLVATDVGKAVTITGVVSTAGTSIVGYDGTFVITAVPSTTTFQYKTPGAGALANGGGGNATYVTNANSGFYVVGPAGARYSTAARVPNLPATLASTGMSITIPSAKIATATCAGTVATITSAAALPPSFTAGQKVVVAGVTVPGYNNTAGNPAWTITAVTGTPTLSFSFNVPAALPPSAGGRASLYIPQITMLLRRLANPSLAFNAGTNPYITVDYLDQIPVTNFPTAGTVTTVGRPQPYQASLPLPAAAPHTFFRHNVAAGAPFDWLVHLDRPPVNPLEMLHVSGYKPHELTQQFVVGANKFQHYAPWNPFVSATSADPNALIYRGLDSMSSRYMAGLIAGGRYPGNINLNTIMEPEIFQALCDAHDSSTTQYPNPWFKQTDVANAANPTDPTTIFGKLLQSRGTPSYTSAPGVEPATPFKSFSAAKTNAGGTQVLLDDTLFRSVGGRPLFAVGATTNHPYLQSSLLQKIYNNVTTTSNVFGVWCTVGYFEVVDESVKPARLGAEIGRSENRHIRHRFFAMVDRSAMQLFNTTVTGAAVPAGVNKTMTYTANVTTITGATSAWIATQSYVSANAVTAGGVTYFCIQANTNKPPAANAAFWQPLLQPGMLLEIDAGANAEVVAVKTVPGGTNTFTADFTKPHTAGVLISCRGNPGPQSNYNPHRDSNVVLHLSIIQ
jgi:hypothetical protein